MLLPAAASAQAADQPGVAPRAPSADLPMERKQLDGWLALIYRRIHDAWAIPPSVQPGSLCVVYVSWEPEQGRVTNVKVGPCNANEEMRQSIVAAVYRASPLPLPPDASLFDPDLTVSFRAPAAPPPPRSREAIESVFNHVKGKINELYHRALLEGPGLHGRLVLEATIAPSGEVTMCRVFASELNDSELEEQITALVRLLHFEPTKGGGSVTFTMPIALPPQ
jgi:TonB family protein